MTPSSTLALSVALCSLVACAGAPAPAPPPPSPSTPVYGPAGQPDPSAGQLSRFAGLTVMVLPAQAVSAVDSLGWRSAGGGDKALLAALDSVLADSLSGRGLGTQWAFPPALRRAASRNPTYVTDPSAMRALDAVRVALRKRDEPLAEPFASQLRALAGVSDARYALIPLDLRFVPNGPGSSGRAALRLAVVDARGAQLVWVGEVAGDPSSTFGSEVLASLAQRVSDLVVSR
ncbi:MAG: hypothetical protein IPF98_14965 [Gemmatimonadetes bacterium]|nr:hypothetical protein [Gemmatimonadota bacterium]